MEAQQVRELLFLTRSFCIILFSIGAVRMVIEQETNMTLGFFSSTAIRDSYMLPSYVYYTTKLVWMVPPGRIISSFEKLLRPFRPILWIFIVLVLATAFAAIRIIKFHSKRLQDFVFGEEVTDPGLNVVNITLGGSLDKLPKKNFSRFILIVFVIYCFVLQNSYTGGLLFFMRTTVRDPEVTSTNEMIHRNFKFLMYESSSLFVSNLDQVMARSEILSADNFTLMLDQIVDPEFNGAFLTSEDHLAYRNILDFPNRYLSHAPEAICTNNLVIYLNKNSCLAFVIDQIIIHLVSGGIIQKWSTGFIDKNFLKNRHSSSAKALNVPQLLGAFQILMAGLSVSLAAFCVETLFSYKPHAKCNK